MTLSLALGLQTFQTWQDVLDKAAATDASSPVVQSDGTVLATDNASGQQVILGRFAPGAIPGTGGVFSAVIGDNAVPMVVQPDSTTAPLPVLFPADAPPLNTGQGTPGLNPVPIYTAFGAGPPAFVAALQDLLQKFLQALADLAAALGTTPWLLLAGAGVLIIAAHHRR